ncbi:GntR family transcriptional regulator [Actinosynnema sp. ALI-1.44]|uniref:GntR family transcriptional regulator n=1 Tax=Actinosynnema sp. ALI-1.44 TaxID=1933779 RepID=UPI00097C53A3|nr:GntR family transcriptional regulator [Actinosynnema sp. ALI-1.44]ONI79611.1 GntR family transcriptional regulator [Actinosynnema sp. ALI-1.44]
MVSGEELAISDQATDGLSKAQRTYQAIRSRIADGTYSPGHRLVLGALAKEFDVSPVPVREAIRLLQAEGLVHFERNIGATVAAIDPLEYQHTMQMLAIVEGAATALAAPHLTADAIAHATDVNDRLRALLSTFDPVAFTQLNHEFHETLYLPCPNPTLIDLVQKGWSRLATIRDSTFSFVPGRAEASVAEHDQLLDLIRTGAGQEWIEHRARTHRTATIDAFLAWESAKHS